MTTRARGVVMMLSEDAVDGLPRRQLQTLCKERGIKANSKTVKLVADLKAWIRANQEEPQQEEGQEQKEPGDLSMPTNPEHHEQHKQQQQQGHAQDHNSECTQQHGASAQGETGKNNTEQLQHQQRQHQQMPERPQQQQQLQEHMQTQRQQTSTDNDTTHMQAEAGFCVVHGGVTQRPHVRLRLVNGCVMVGDAASNTGSGTDIGSNSCASTADAQLLRLVLEPAILLAGKSTRPTHMPDNMICSLCCEANAKRLLRLTSCPLQEEAQQQQQHHHQHHHHQPTFSTHPHARAQHPNAAAQTHRRQHQHQQSGRRVESRLPRFDSPARQGFEHHEQHPPAHPATATRAAIARQPTRNASEPATTATTTTATKTATTPTTTSEAKPTTATVTRSGRPGRTSMKKTTQRQQLRRHKQSRRDKALAARDRRRTHIIDRIRDIPDTSKGKENQEAATAVSTKDAVLTTPPPPPKHAHQHHQQRRASGHVDRFRRKSMSRRRPLSPRFEGGRSSLCPDAESTPSLPASPAVRRERGERLSLGCLRPPRPVRVSKAGGGGGGGGGGGFEVKEDIEYARRVDQLLRAGLAEEELLSLATRGGPNAKAGVA
ncbi:hypothetical protein PTSG_11644 [Salpingoeca rosetta]|uniref:SAP domain-containing protein n=1 Tax=Salpingoeca rosetta (strain ATCC 50818 / BSB-021) TaxID=946362 RepID=F2TXI2_SALR5|nr:uncharacterized protein PTSG_11644 [Salpingoeca rosetta]EGD76091.1 hypothetical protein PTSG_11644 [Salpingoeca rosetta]|eukprot:XP_004998266.1 hypothetical protein PTSG_11644 [Salpingoeca rosetta]